jgi:hypothetical protein
MYFETIKALNREFPLDLTIKGECMTGTLPDGSRVRTQRRAIYWPGDVIVYARGETMVCHRFLGYVRGRRAWLAITRADNGHEADALFPTWKILGKVVSLDGEQSPVIVKLRFKAVRQYLAAALCWLKTKI